MEVMICLSQGGLLSLSTSSFKVYKSAHQCMTGHLLTVSSQYHIPCIHRHHMLCIQHGMQLRNLKWTTILIIRNTNQRNIIIFLTWILLHILISEDYPKEIVLVLQIEQGNECFRNLCSPKGVFATWLEQTFLIDSFLAFSCSTDSLIRQSVEWCCVK